MRGKKLSIGLTAVLGMLGAISITVGTPAAAEETVLYTFDCEADGCEPVSNLIFDAAGNLYGTTVYGGTFGNGTVFELSPQADGSWVETVLHSFEPPGYGVPAGLIFDAEGNLYGTTVQGGDYNLGTVFELMPAAGGVWTESVLHSFGNGMDGAKPFSGLISDAAGNLYGTTSVGGEHQQGTAFELTRVSGVGWTEKVLYSFRGGKDGSQPYADLTLDAAGNVYGTTAFGDIHNGGTVFELSPNPSGDWSEKILHGFGQDAGPTTPFSGVIFDRAGNLYGTLSQGGSDGAVFELRPTADGHWTGKVLHNFAFDGAGGSEPHGGLIIDTAGNLYGTTVTGGSHNTACSVTGCGTVFELVPAAGGNWTEKVLFAFNYTGGMNPWGTLIFDASGNLYGTTAVGGAGEFGTVFEITH